MDTVNPIVPSNVVVVEADTGRAKKGDGHARYASLPYMDELGTGGGTVTGIDQAALDAAIAPLQRSDTAATDAELAAAVTALNTALAAKQDVASDKGREIASVILNAGLTPATATEENIPGASIVVPANSGAVELLVPSGVYLAATTGTNAATVQQAARIWIRDEANNLIGYFPWTYYGTGASQQMSDVMPVGALVGNNAADKTYRLTMQIQRLGTLGATGQFISGGIFGPASFRATAR